MRKFCFSNESSIVVEVCINSMLKFAVTKWLIDLIDGMKELDMQIDIQMAPPICGYISAYKMAGIHSET